VNVAAHVHALFYPRTQQFAVLEGRLHNRRMTAKAPRNTYSGPLLILTGPATGSSSELLAARMQETMRATVVGPDNARRSGRITSG
jgi:carboxyl-terminal processing protease